MGVVCLSLSVCVCVVEGPGMPFPPFLCVCASRLFLLAYVKKGDCTESFSFFFFCCSLACFPRATVTALPFPPPFASSLYSPSLFLYTCVQANWEERRTTEKCIRWWGIADHWCAP